MADRNLNNNWCFEPLLAFNSDNRETAGGVLEYKKIREGGGAKGC